MGGSRARAARFVLGGLTAMHIVQAVLLRRRYARLAALGAPPSGHREGTASTIGLDGDEVVVLAVAGAHVDDATVRSAAWEMEATGVEVIDVLPGDLTVEQLLQLLLWVDPKLLSEDPFYAPGGAHQALVVRRSVAERVGLAGGSASLDRDTLARLTVEAQRCAPRTKAVRWAPTSRAVRDTARDRWRELDRRMAPAKQYPLAAWVAGLHLAHLAALTGGVFVAPVAGAAALLTWSAQPRVVLGKQHLGASLLRLPCAWATHLGTTLAGSADRRVTRAEASGSGEAQAPGVVSSASMGELFEEPRSSCPWCGSESLVGRLDTRDLLQGKPGAFHLDECTGCGHVFQNPALSTRGLEYYYQDFYDGPNAGTVEAMFEGQARLYTRRLEAITRFTEPQAWLDVGAGHGHFSLAAHQAWPKAIFDGLDLSSAIEDAARRGWVDTGHRGLFPDLASGLQGAYDVVSMYHYLEHTREPRRELAAAAEVLRPGGYLTIEVPDAESPWARRLGGYWFSWFQPQHQHFVTCDNLVAELEATGWEVVSVQRAPATAGKDLSLALSLVVGEATSPPLSRSPQSGIAERAKRQVVSLAAMPALGLAFAADVVKDAMARRPRSMKPGNAYRVVARRRP